MRTLIKPNKLTHGDTIATITLSWGGAGLFSYRYEVGKRRLENIFGLKVVETKHATRDPDWTYQHPKARAADLMSAFENPDIKGIFSMIGKDDSVRLLPYIDYDIIKNAFEFSERIAKQIMIPRTQVMAIDVEDFQQEMVEHRLYAQ